MSVHLKPEALRPRPEPWVPVAANGRPTSLENGDRLTASEFLRRYETAKSLKKAQLIEGIVNMPSPVRADAHAAPDNLVQFWLGYYAMRHPGLAVYTNATLLIDSDNAPQPDAILCSAPRPEGRVWLNDRGYLSGSPELVCEIAASSVSIDLHDKFRVYRRAGINEYLVWLTEEERVCWFHLEDQEYVEKTREGGRLSSAVFLGLVLDLDALLKMDRAKLIAAVTG